MCNTQLCYNALHTLSNELGFLFISRKLSVITAGMRFLDRVVIAMVVCDYSLATIAV